jgi:hypothetical protein
MVYYMFFHQFITSIDTSFNDYQLWKSWIKMVDRNIRFNTIMNDSFGFELHCFQTIAMIFNRFSITSLIDMLCLQDIKGNPIQFVTYCPSKLNKLPDMMSIEKVGLDTIGKQSLDCLLQQICPQLLECIHQPTSPLTGPFTHHHRNLLSSNLKVICFTDYDDMNNDVSTIPDYGPDSMLFTKFFDTPDSKDTNNYHQPIVKVPIIHQSTHPQTSTTDNIQTTVYHNLLDTLVSARVIDWSITPFYIRLLYIVYVCYAIVHTYFTSCSAGQDISFIDIPDFTGLFLLIHQWQGVNNNLIDNLLPPISPSAPFWFHGHYGYPPSLAYGHFGYPPTSHFLIGHHYLHVGIDDGEEFMVFDTDDPIIFDIDNLTIVLINPTDFCVTMDDGEEFIVFDDTIAPIGFYDINDNKYLDLDLDLVVHTNTNYYISIDDGPISPTTNDLIVFNKPTITLFLVNHINTDYPITTKTIVCDDPIDISSSPQLFFKQSDEFILIDDKSINHDPPNDGIPPILYNLDDLIEPTIALVIQDYTTQEYKQEPPFLDISNHDDPTSSTMFDRDNPILLSQSKMVFTNDVPTKSSSPPIIYHPKIVIRYTITVNIKANGEIHQVMIVQLLDDPTFEYDWTPIVYGELTEVKQLEKPTTLDKFVMLTQYHHTNWMHDNTIEQLFLNSFHTMNKTLMDWSFTKQNNLGTVIRSCIPTNPANIISKHWDCFSVQTTMKAVLSWMKIHMVLTVLILPYHF